MSGRILIAGASSVLGLATAGKLEEAGRELWLTHCRSEKAEALRSRFPDVRISRLDVRAPEQIEELSKQVQEQWGGLDGLVCAFGAGALLPAHRLTHEATAAMMEVNLGGAVEVARRFYPLLLKGRDPAVVFFSSTMGLVGAGGMNLYAAVKGGIASLTRALAMEWAPRRIRVNAVAPGIVPSPLVETMFAALAPEQVKAIEERHPLGFGEPADVANAVHFLLSREAKWITGVVLPVDGGYTAQ